jgi:hypothetical protein
MYKENVNQMSFYIVQLLTGWVWLNYPMGNVLLEVNDCILNHAWMMLSKNARNQDQSSHQDVHEAPPELLIGKFVEA